MSFILVYKKLIWDTYLGELRIHATKNNIPPIHFQFKLNYLWCNFDGLMQFRPNKTSCVP